jgi:DNA polymerase
MIVFVGATALRFCTGETRGITRVRGQWLTHRGHPAMAIFHPSYLLRNPARTHGSPKWLTWRDIRAVRARLDELTGVSDARSP